MVNWRVHSATYALCVMKTSSDLTIACSHPGSRKEHIWDLSAYSGFKRGCDIKIYQNQRCGLLPKAPSRYLYQVQKPVPKKEVCRGKNKKQPLLLQQLQEGVLWGISVPWQRTRAHRQWCVAGVQSPSRGLRKMDLVNWKWEIWIIATAGQLLSTQAEPRPIWVSQEGRQYLSCNHQLQLL